MIVKEDGAPILLLEDDKGTTINTRSGFWPFIELPFLGRDIQSISLYKKYNTNTNFWSNNICGVKVGKKLETLDKSYLQ